MPCKMNRGKFNYSPFITKALKEASYIFVRNDEKAKTPLQARYTGPFKVKEKKDILR